MHDTIRSFLAIEIPESVRKQIALYVSGLKSLAPGLKWIKEESLHITLKFFGEQSTRHTEQIITSLLEINNFAGSFEILIKDFGAFPNEKKPRVFWLGIEAIPRETFFNLFKNIESKMEQIGFEREQRKFSPHLTLARTKSPDNFSDLWNYVAEYPFSKAHFEVNNFVLMQSILKPMGAQYRIIQKYPLRR